MDNIEILDFSDDEQEQLSWKEARLGFGKYRGARFTTMLATRGKRSYLRYLLNWDELRPTSRNHITAALQHYETRKEAVKPPLAAVKPLLAVDEPLPAADEPMSTAGEPKLEVYLSSGKV